MFPKRLQTKADDKARPGRRRRRLPARGRGLGLIAFNLKRRQKIRGPRAADYLTLERRARGRRGNGSKLQIRPTAAIRAPPVLPRSPISLFKGVPTSVEKISPGEFRERLQKLLQGIHSLFIRRAGCSRRGGAPAAPQILKRASP
ncbi:hypothetical protein EVAR_103209_1 [Eumeta japonica]|uniref:Uncharacterized protein n=1 Tax=Eumeta variegata TaxID=151549 RepID=A0A4C2A2L2_EUMVA|nr:hypothetical protein EVAR_103209_1 [Eumeta japonica]